MERNREARRASIVGSNGFNRRRHRSNNLRDSSDEVGGLEFQESVRLRDRVKKDRDRERDRERERERGRDLRERSSRGKRRRTTERPTSNREEIGEDETSEESVNDDEMEEYDENTAASGIVGPLTPATGSVPNHNHAPPHFINHHQGHSHTSSFAQQNNNSPINIPGVNHHLQHRKSFPPASSSWKASRAPPVWKPGDEMISVSVPRKARSASTKRSHDWVSNNSGGVPGGDQILRQALDSPVRQGLVSTSTPSPAAPVSPSSSNVSARKKLKPSGAKPKPPKVSAKLSSSNPEELEIEIAEVLYGLMTQSQGPPPPKNEETKDVNRSNSDAKSRNSSPISNSTSATNPTSGPNSSSLSAVAPKRKRPRQIADNSSHGGARSSPLTEMATKPDADQTTKNEISSPALEKIGGAAAENGYETGGNSLFSNKPPAESASTPESTKLDLEVKKTVAKELTAEEAENSPKEKETAPVRAEESDSRSLPAPLVATASLGATGIESNSVASDVENHKEEKFEIDLMAPPMVDQKPVLSVIDPDLKDKEVRVGTLAQESKLKGSDSEVVLRKAAESKLREIHLQLDLEKHGGDGVGGLFESKLQHHFEKQQRQQEMQVKATKDDPVAERSGRTMATTLPLPLSLTSWPTGLPPMGYMAPLPGVVSMDGSAMAPTPIQPLFSQPRPKRCATHCYIARNIHSLQQFMKMNPFLSAPTPSKPCNLNVIPATDLQGSIASRGVGNVQDKGQNVSTGPSNNGKEKGSKQAGAPESAQKKQQILFQQTMPPVAPNNILGPTFIFPLNQQQTGMPTWPGVPKSPLGATSSNNSSSAAASASAAAAVSFNYPNVAANETQYLAILPNNAYPFPIPAVGPPPNFRGAPGQAMPLFNGSFYSSQMIHPSQFQHPQQLPSPQAQQLQQVQQNTNASSGSSAPQKHSHNLQQRPQSGGGNCSSVSTNVLNFPGQKGQQSQQLQSLHNQYMHSSPPRQLEGEGGSEDQRPTTTDNRGSRASKNVYGQNFIMPLHPQNYAMLTPSAAFATGATSGSSTDKSHQTQQPISKGAVDSLAPQSFAMSFGPINGVNTGPGIDMSTMAQNHVIFKNTSEASRQNMQMMAAAAAAAAPVAHQKNFRIPEDNKPGPSDSSTTDDDRRNFSGKALGGGGQSIVFSRSELADGAAASIQASSVIESSSRSNVASGSSQGQRPVMSSAHIKFQNAHIQSQMQQQQQQQMLQQQQQMLQQLKHQQPQQMSSATASRNKVPPTSNGIAYSDHTNSSSAMSGKFPVALSGFPPNLVQSNSNSPVQSPQWKSSTRVATSQAPSSLGSSGAMAQKVSQQHLRTQSLGHTQISFGGNQKQSSMSSGQAPHMNDQAPSSSMMVGSPTNSMSKGASGSPRTASASNATKMGQASSLSSQQAKNSPSIPSQKTLSVLGNPHVTSSASSNSVKAQMLQPQQQLPKTIQPTQLFFSNPCHSQRPSTGTSSTTSSPSGYYMQRRRQDQHQQPACAPVTSSTGMLSLCPPSTLASATTNDPAKAMAAATGNVKVSRMSSQGNIQASPFSVQSTGTMFPAGFSCSHPVPSVVQVKSGEPKQGQDNMHTWQSEKK